MSASWFCIGRETSCCRCYCARGACEPFDGVTGLWFDADDLLRLMQTDSSAAAAGALLEDERRFIDLARSPIFLAEDYVAMG